MVQSQTARTESPDLEALALAFVVQSQGSWTSEVLETWRAELSRQHLAPSPDELEVALTQARQVFESERAHLFLCAGKPCQLRQKFDTSDETLQRVAAEGGHPITITACQGPCNQAPVATLRLGQRSEMLAQFMGAADWQTVTDFARRAATADTLLISPDRAEPFRFDPVHDHEDASSLLQGLTFLLGHFSGEGIFADGSESFQKEAVGEWQVAGRFLGLRMGVTYPLADGRKDTHTAFAMLGVDSSTGELESQVYTDGGSIYLYHLEQEGEAITFSDRANVHHGMAATRARKVLLPTEYGFEERLELDHGTGQFELYYTILMYRLGTDWD